MLVDFPILIFFSFLNFITDNPEPTKQELFDKTAEEKRKKKEEKTKRKKEQQEKLRENERKNHVRPWDKEKFGTEKSGVRKSRDSDAEDDDSDEEEWTYRPEREPMSQEQWNEKERSKRNMEFAPIPNDTVVINSKAFDPKGVEYEEYENRTLNFTTKKRKPFVVRHVDEPVGVPVRDELISDYISSRRGAEVAPPANLDDGTHTSKKKRVEPSIESSIEAGLRYLREQSDKGTLSTKLKWTSNADY